MITASISVIINTLVDPLHKHVDSANDSNYKTFCSVLEIMLDMNSVNSALLNWIYTLNREMSPS